MKKRDRGIWKALGMVTQLGISILTPILLCCIFGYYMNQWFHVSFWFPVFFVFGLLAALRSTYLLTRSFYAADLKREQEELKYFEDLKNYSKKHTKEEQNKSNRKDE